MRFDGEWLQCDDEILRPIIRAEILAGDSVWRAFELLVDTGADGTVISANVLESLPSNSSGPGDRIGGIGGTAATVTLNTEIRLTRDDSEKAIFRGEYVAVADPETLDMSVLSRDILDMFALVVDFPSTVVAIIGGQHHYTIGPHPR